MHNLKDIRNNTEAFSESLKKRFIDLDLNMILKMDESEKDQDAVPTIIMVMKMFEKDLKLESEKWKTDNKEIMA